MKRSFRVAAVFTGAAAAVAFTPAVNAVAMPGAATQVPKGQEVTPNITEENCNSGTRTWIHLYYTAAEHHGPACFAHPGSYVVPNHNTVFQGYCAGNNYGFITGVTPSGVSSLATFIPGYSFTFVHSLHHVVVVQTKGVNGSYTCPQ